MSADNFEERLSYLISGSFDVLPSSYIKLRSYLNIHSSKLAEESNVRAFKKKNELCPYCFTAWTCDTSSFKLLPSKKVRKRKGKTEVNSEGKETLQKNTMLIKCRVCTRRSHIKLMKKKLVNENIPKEEEKPVTKKKKKKDKTCGLLVNLRQTAVSSLPLLNFQKKKELQPVNVTKEAVKTQTNPLIKLPKNKQTSLSKQRELVLNPFSLKVHEKQHRKAQEKLIKLRKALKNTKTATKKSLSDFLTLI